MKNPIVSLPRRGFALVVTLILMIILTVVAVGLLSLSTISIRSSGQGQAMATARANARFALLMAIGDLQKSVGPDRAITANSEILEISPDNIKKYNTTGVWESWWDFNPNSSPSPDYAAQKTSRFRRWLVSSANPTANLSRDFALAAWPSDAITLVGGGSLGVADNAKTRAIAGRVNVSAGKSKGAYAWHVADESQKARINAYRDPTKNTTLAEKTALLAGHRPDPSVIDSKLAFLPNDSGTTADERKDNFEKATKIASKLSSLSQFDLVNTNPTPGKLKEFRNDITPYSLGVITDVRNGGLKQDLSSVFEMSTKTSINLPAEFSGNGASSNKLYQTTLGSDFTGEDFADPSWTNLAGYYNSFRNIKRDETSPEMDPPATITERQDYGVDKSIKVDEKYYPGPAITKVDTIFSLLTRPVNEIGWWAGVGVHANYDYFTSLIYTPVVTLHNPYNFSISFYKMEVSFTNVPVAFRIMFKASGTSDFVSQSVVAGEFESINDMTNNVEDRDNKTFKIAIADWVDDELLANSTDISKPIIMKPGETIVCGPRLPATANFGNEIAFDWNKINKITEKIKAKPGYTPGIGFEVNGVAISNLGELGTSPPGGAGPGWCSHLLLRDESEAPNVAKGTDEFYVEFKAQIPSWHNQWRDATSQKTVIKAEPSYVVDTKIQTSATGQLVDYAKLQFDYTDDSGLKNYFDNQTHRSPSVGTHKATTFNTPLGSTYASQGLDQYKFAIFSAHARTTNGGVYGSNARSFEPGESPLNQVLKDGRLAGKPMLFHNPSKANLKVNLGTQKAGVQAYELNLQPFEGNDDFTNSFPVDGRRIPSITGNSEVRGIFSGSYLELPIGPMQTIADFRRSNVLTSAFQPQFVQPIGNSLLHPLMSPGKVIENDPSIQRGPMLDQSVLGNLALYDRFYFSTFATRDTEKPAFAFERFMDRSGPLLSQAFQPFLPTGKTISSAKAELFAGGVPKDTAYQNAAEYQMVTGPFNVNSTNVKAWKAALATMNKAEISTLWAKTAALEASDCDGIPILSMSIPNGGKVGGSAADGKIDNQRTNDWNGHRVINDSELTTLATCIVKQVRLRGPFLSMSEFVNRQVGPESPLSLSGALEQAISDSKINEIFLSGYVTNLELASFDDPAPPALPLYGYKTKSATIGNPAAGAPGWVSQGDLLRILEPAATVRSDTFVIRVCGQAQDGTGNVTASAYAEAVIQRTPEYIDPVDRPSLNAYDITVPRTITSPASITNKSFGRRMNIISFRWLSSSEI